MTIRVGIVGCGMIAIKRHFPELAQNPNVKIAACSDYVAERSASMAGEYGCSAYTDHRVMLEKEHLDALVVCTNNATHKQVTLDGFDRGLHVLCEKPMAANLEEAKAMVEAGKRAGRLLMIAQNQRMSGAYRKAKEILSGGKLGRVLSFRTVFGHPGCEFWSIDGLNSWFFDPALAAFGCLADLGVHKVDLMRWLLDEEFTEVFAYKATRDKKKADGTPVDVEDNMTGVLRSESGVIGTIATSWTYYGPEDNSSVFYCERGILSVLTDPEFMVKVDYPDGTGERYIVPGVGSNERPVKSGIPDEFISAILEDRAPAITGEDGYNSLAVAVALDASATSGRPAAVQHYQA